jgi:hypothetical protein
MKITIESTSQIVTIQNRENEGHVQGRVWDGHTDTGIYVQCVITRIAAPADADQSQFKRELKQCRTPEPGEMVFPLRMIV